MMAKRAVAAVAAVVLLAGWALAQDGKRVRSVRMWPSYRSDLPRPMVWANPGFGDVLMATYAQVPEIDRSEILALVERVERRVRGFGGSAADEGQGIDLYLVPPTSV